MITAKIILILKSHGFIRFGVFLLSLHPAKRTTKLTSLQRKGWKFVFPILYLNLKQTFNILVHYNVVVFVFFVVYIIIMVLFPKWLTYKKIEKSTTSNLKELNVTTKIFKYAFSLSLKSFSNEALYNISTTFCVYLTSWLNKTREERKNHFLNFLFHSQTNQKLA